MSARRTLTISITPELDAVIRACLSSGRYGTASEIVRAALRLLETTEARTVKRRVNTTDGWQTSP